MIIFEIPKILKKMNSVGQAHLGFIILVNKKSNIEAITHESIHIKQQRELLVIFWYLLYMINFLYLFWILGDFRGAYKKVIFEKEAYKYEKDINYLNSRKPFAWLR